MLSPPSLFIPYTLPLWSFRPPFNPLRIIKLFPASGPLHMPFPFPGTSLLPSELQFSLQTPAQSPPPWGNLSVIPPSTPTRGSHVLLWNVLMASALSSHAPVYIYIGLRVHFFSHLSLKPLQSRHHRLFCLPLYPQHIAQNPANTRC